MGVTASTPANLVIGAGNVLIDDEDVGATTGNNTFTITQTIFEPELNGIPGKLVGTQYKRKRSSAARSPRSAPRSSRCSGRARRNPAESSTTTAPGASRRRRSTTTSSTWMA